MRRRKLACDVDAAGAQQDANIPTNATQPRTTGWSAGAGQSSTSVPHTSVFLPPNFSNDQYLEKQKIGFETSTKSSLRP
jgi:hypothetical protein